MNGTIASGLVGRPALPVDAPPAQTIVQIELTDEDRRRMESAAVYQDGDLHVLHEAGAITMHPQGQRVFMRAILRRDASELAIGVPYDARDAIAMEVIEVGGAVDRYLDTLGVPDDARDTRSLRQRLSCWWQGRGVQAMARPRPGDHVYVLSTAADRASKTDRACRLWFAHVDDVSAGWLVPR